MLVDGCFILELLYRFDELKSKTKEAKNTPKEEGQEGKRNGASTSSDLSTPLLQTSHHFHHSISSSPPPPSLSLTHTNEPPRDRMFRSEVEMKIL
ncbi:hypothetical protein RHMOL_Rhmol05G0293400 [Rhododendron molle]|uniref:Uncharacterized protein n=1 Tax=Rhododendron molle TaxID=49168 RepID=A0ACC0NWN5_RHOML|nr:hypothetical protein RHMOL_Rhmol05G0293400 [Rhododendron molle]